MHERIHYIKRSMDSWTQKIPWRKSAGAVCSSSLQILVVICFITNSIAPRSPQLLHSDLLWLVPALAAPRSINAWGRDKRRDEERTVKETDREERVQGVRMSERRPGLMNKTAAATHWGPAWVYFSEYQLSVLQSASRWLDLQISRYRTGWPQVHHSMIRLLKKRNTANPQWNSRQLCITHVPHCNTDTVFNNTVSNELKQSVIIVPHTRQDSTQQDIFTFNWNNKDIRV